MICRRGVEGAAPYAYETGLFDEPRPPRGRGRFAPKPRSVTRGQSFSFSAIGTMVSGFTLQTFRS